MFVAVFEKQNGPKISFWAKIMTKAVLWAEGYSILGHVSPCLHSAPDLLLDFGITMAMCRCHGTSESHSFHPLPF